jgi:23S rRNA (adenine-N6)-dimethyltransferase
VRANGARRYGFHQLTDHWAARIVADAAVPAAALVLDVGAGTGALTRHLVATGARVIAIEVHPTRAVLLRQRFQHDAVTVVRVDASDLRLPRRPFRVVANPPFSITAAILRRLLAPGSRLVAADIVLPAHVAYRWAEGRAPGSGRWRLDYMTQVSARLPRSAFVPPATTATAVLQVRQRAVSARVPRR